MKELSIILLVLLAVSINVFSNTMENLVSKLDKSIAKREYYIHQKEDKLNQLKTDLANISSNNTLEKYKINRQLMDEYSYFISEEALFYSAQCIELAKKLNKDEYILDSQLSRVELLCYPGFYHEAFTILDGIDLKTLSNSRKADYYYTYLLVLHLQIRNLSSPYYMAQYKEKVMQYIDKYFSVTTDTNKNYLFVLAYKYYQRGEFQSTIETMQRILNNPNISPYTYATTMFYMGIVYLQMRDEKENAEATLINASIRYNELAVMRNPTLFYLAQILNENKDVNRAYNYVRVAIEDFRKFNDNRDYRFALQDYSVLQNAYYAKIQKQQNVLQTYSIVLSVFFIILVVAILYILRHNKELRTIRAQLCSANQSLKDSNYVKEIYIGHYLNQCSFYIDKLDEHKKLIIKKLKESKSKELKVNDINAMFDTKNDINNLLLDFDETFLKLYPNFIKELNNLLTKENYYILKSNHENRPRLNAEIRILALLKLGITDNKKIASFLRFTVQTVYNYRSKAKSRAINEDSFEEDIKKINT